MELMLREHPDLLEPGLFVGTDRSRIVHPGIDHEPVYVVACPQVVDDQTKSLWSEPPAPPGRVADPHVNSPGINVLAQSVAREMVRVLDRVVLDQPDGHSTMLDQADPDFRLTANARTILREKPFERPCVITAIDPLQHPVIGEPLGDKLIFRQFIPHRANQHVAPGIGRRIEFDIHSQCLSHGNAVASHSYATASRERHQNRYVVPTALWTYESGIAAAIACCAL